VYIKRGGPEKTWEKQPRAVFEKGAKFDITIGREEERR